MKSGHVRFGAWHLGQLSLCPYFDHHHRHYRALEQVMSYDIVGFQPYVAGPQPCDFAGVQPYDFADSVGSPLFDFAGFLLSQT